MKHLSLLLIILLMISVAFAYDYTYTAQGDYPGERTVTVDDTYGYIHFITNDVNRQWVIVALRDDFGTFEFNTTTGEVSLVNDTVNPLSYKIEILFTDWNTSGSISSVGANCSEVLGTMSGTADIISRNIDITVDGIVIYPENETPSSEEYSGWFAGVVNAVNDVFDAVGSILSFLNPASDNFFLKVAFVPSEDYFQNFWTEIKTAFDNKIPLVSQLATFLNTITTSSYSETPPEFKVSLPAKYGGVDCDVVDFSIFGQYRDFILNFIRFTSWFVFLKRLYKKIPSMIY